MEQFLKHTHSDVRWLVLVTAVVAIVLPFENNKTAIGKKDKLPALAFMIMCDVQLLMGLILYFVYSAMGFEAFSSGMKTVMSTAPIRKIAVEHFVMMLAAITLVHIGYAKLKKATDVSKFKKIGLIYFGIALVLILAGIPWDRF
ncbi:MAG: cytochrome B [Bacteroidetes bacterium]|nr:cytochrome B [Bacteroidota bacterium]